MPVGPQRQHAPHGDLPRMALQLVDIIGPGADIRRIQHLAVRFHDIGAAAPPVEARHQAHHDAGIRGKQGHGALVPGLDAPAFGDVHGEEAVRIQRGGDDEKREYPEASQLNKQQKFLYFFTQYNHNFIY